MSAVSTTVLSALHQAIRSWPLLQALMKASRSLAVPMPPAHARAQESSRAKISESLFITK